MLLGTVRFKFRRGDPRVLDVACTSLCTMVILPSERRCDVSYHPFCGTPGAVCIFAEPIDMCFADQVVLWRRFRQRLVVHSPDLRGATEQDNIRVEEMLHPEFGLVDPRFQGTPSVAVRFKWFLQPQPCIAVASGSSSQ